MTTTSESRPRIVFLGTAEFGIPSLKILVDNKYPVVAVVTNPDKPAGRGRQLSCSPVKDFASQHVLQILQPESLRDVAFIQQLKSLEPDILVVVAFRILPPDVFMTARLGAFNLHASLLPKYRGAAPIQWAIISGEKETGVTTFLLEEKVDTGNVVLQARIPIGENVTAGEIHDRLSEVGAEIVLHTVRLIESGKAVPRPQDPAAASRAPKIFKEHCRVDWNRTAAEIHNLIRGLSPRPGAFTMYQGNTIKMYRSRVLKDSKPTHPGEILQADRQLVVSTKDGAVEILELQQEGKSKLAAETFLRGFRLQIGHAFLP